MEEIISSILIIYFGIHIAILLPYGFDNDKDMPSNMALYLFLSTIPLMIMTFCSINLYIMLIYCIIITIFYIMCEYKKIIKNRKEEREQKKKEDFYKMKNQIIEFLGGYKRIIKDEYKEEYKNNTSLCYVDPWKIKTIPCSKSVEIFEANLKLIQFLNENYRNKTRVESLNNYVFELFQQLKSFDEELNVNSFKLCELQIEELLSKYNGLLLKMKSETIEIEKQIQETNNKKTKQHFNSKLKEMCQLIDSLTEDFIEND